MPKFRRKPTVIEAHQWDGDWPAVVRWLESLPRAGTLLVPFGEKPGIVLEDTRLILTTTHSDPAPCRLGDWVIPESEPNRFYPCKPDIFDATYDAVEATA